MIGFLSGQIIYAENNSIILDVHGVGYQISITKLLKPSTKIKKFFIHTHVKEDEISLFGFSTHKELKLFQNLISVSGIGPKIAISILTTAKDKDIISAIKNSSVDFFSAISGIGKKTAQKLIIDLKSKLDNSLVDLSNFEENSNLVDGLTSLGFAKKEIQKIIPQIKPNLELSKQIKIALNLLNK